MSGDSTLLQYERAYGPFTHMSIQEKYIWLRFLQSGGTSLAPFTYDVRVGNGLVLPANSSGYTIRAAAALTTKRIDVLYYEGSLACIVEVKVRAGAGAVGQLITYRDLFLATPGFVGSVKMILITDSLQADMAHVLEQNNINWLIV